MKRETLKEFHARMQRIAGIQPRDLSRRVGSHMKFHCGDRVTDKGDQRHQGRVESVIQGMVRVKWDDSRWVSHVDPADLMQVRYGEELGHV